MKKSIIMVLVGSIFSMGIVMQNSIVYAAGGFCSRCDCSEFRIHKNSSWDQERNRIFCKCGHYYDDHMQSFH